ncbi:alpha-L-rhamnosidase [bacterium A37T11]|nr:alpha-L-rhamnosidase [bacterium A37T11]
MKLYVMQLLLMTISLSVIAQNKDELVEKDYFGHRLDWLAEADKAKPVLVHQEIVPLQLIRLEKDSSSFQGWKAVQVGPVDSFYSRGMKEQKQVVIDFGKHYTGFVTVHIAPYKKTPDAPIRLKFTFGEVPSEVAVAFDPYPGGLSRAWLQDEVVIVSEVPAIIQIPRRLAFRYVKIELMGTGVGFDFKISQLNLLASTSVTAQPDSLKAGTSPLLKSIDSIGLNTLKECMQTVFEDGPKRDRRLWVGDMYLESLANGQSFKQQALTKRYLFLFAALVNKDGYLHGSVFESPTPHEQVGNLLWDYALLYNVALRNYFEATGDIATAQSLWPVAKRQLDTGSQPNELSSFEM